MVSFINSKGKNFIFRKTYARDYFYGNMAFELIGEDNKPYQAKFSDIHF